MYECRCAADGKKLAEMARPPLPDLTYRYRCRCGRDRTVPASVDPVTHRIIARANCACGQGTPVTVVFKAVRSGRTDLTFQKVDFRNSRRAPIPVRAHPARIEIR